MKPLKLIESAKQGDQRAFKSIYNQYYGLLYSYVGKLHSDTHTVQDIVSVTFTKAFRRIERYQPSHNFSTWLCAIAYNTFIDTYRRDNTKLVTCSLEKLTAENFTIVTTLKTNERNALELLTYQEDLDDVRRAIKKLKPRYQRIIHMRFYEEMSYKEMHEKLNINEGTLKSHLFRAKEDLGNILK